MHTEKMDLKQDIGRHTRSGKSGCESTSSKLSRSLVILSTFALILTLMPVPKVTILVMRSMVNVQKFFSCTYVIVLDIYGGWWVVVAE